MLYALFLAQGIQISGQSSFFPTSLRAAGEAKTIEHSGDRSTGSPLESAALRVVLAVGVIWGRCPAELDEALLTY